LATDFSDSLQQLDFFAILVGHDMPPGLNYTHPGYSINRVGV
jgi:hypothetical protein